MILPIDIASRVSPELSTIIESVASDADAEQPVTLGSVKVSMAEGVGEGLFDVDRSRLGGEQSLFAEIEALIQQYGEDALAIDFVSMEASENLSRVIEAAINDAENPPTLGVVRGAITDGLAAALVGEGAIDPDEDETLLAEIDTLIDRYGEDIPAERFIRYE